MDSFNTHSILEILDQPFEINDLNLLDRAKIARLPFSLKILLENLLRHEDGVTVDTKQVESLLNWDPSVQSEQEISFTPARVILQDFTGVPAIVDLACMRDA
ncbi:aconitate hydratase, partial [bacterium]|nr:aconitate hydratase [bacterium]